MLRADDWFACGVCLTADICGGFVWLCCYAWRSGLASFGVLWIWYCWCCVVVYSLLVLGLVIVMPLACHDGLLDLGVVLVACFGVVVVSYACWLGCVLVLRFVVGLALCGLVRYAFVGFVGFVLLFQGLVLQLCLWLLVVWFVVLGLLFYSCWLLWCSGVLDSIRVDIWWAGLVWWLVVWVGWAGLVWWLVGLG